MRQIIHAFRVAMSPTRRFLSLCLARAEAFSLPQSPMLSKCWAILSLIIISASCVFLLHNITLGMSPLWSDEFGYFRGVKAFQLYDSLIAPLTLHSAFSANGEYGLHGPLYSILYASVGSALSYNADTLILLINSVIYVLNMLLAYFIIGRYRNIAYFGMFILVYHTYFVTLMFHQTYMIEAVHFMFGLMSAGLLGAYLEKRTLMRLLLFVGFIFLISFFRVFWIALLCGLSLALVVDMLRTRVDRGVCLLHAGMSAVGVVAIFWAYINVTIPMLAPYPSFLSQFLAMLSSGDDTGAWSFFQDHLLWNFSNITDFKLLIFDNYQKLVYLAFLLLCFVLYVFRGSFVYLLCVSVIFCSFMIILLVYDTSGWRDHRSLAGYWVFVCTLLLIYKRLAPVLMVLLCQVAMLYPVYGHVKSSYNERFATTAQMQSRDRNEYQSIALLQMLADSPLTKTKDYLVVGIWRAPPENAWRLLADLPFETRDGIAISYSFLNNFAKDPVDYLYLKGAECSDYAPEYAFYKAAQVGKVCHFIKSP